MCSNVPLGSPLSKLRCRRAAAGEGLSQEGELAAANVSLPYNIRGHVHFEGTSGQHLTDLPVL